MKFKNLLLIIFAFFALTFNVEAMTVKPTGPVKTGRGKDIEVFITLSRNESEKQVSAVDGTFSYDTNFLTLKSQSSLLSNWTELSSVSNGAPFSYANLSFNNLITKTSTNVAKLIFTVNANATYGTTNITISNPSATDETGSGVDITGGSLSLQIVSDVNTLSSLKINGSSVDNFNSNTTTYSKTFDTNTTSINIEATKTDSRSTITGDLGVKSLKEGLNVFTITVTSEAGTTKTYTLNITRKSKEKSNVNTLSSLKIDGVGVANFNSNTTTYSKTVKSDKTSITIEAVKTDSKSTITGDIGKKNLNYGLNNFKITVTSESGVKKEYVLKITREDNRSKVNTLKSLTLSSGTINFKPNTNTYDLKLDKDVLKITIMSTLTDSKSTYVNGFGNREVTLNEGLNVVLIKIKAENENINTYTLNITRGEIEEDKTKNANIKELVISNYDLDFSSSIFDYNLTINEEEKLDINVVLEQETATYEILNNENLSDGSQIIIRVTSEDKTNTKEYNINITKNLEDDNNQDLEDDEQNDKTDNTNGLNPLYIGIGIASLGLILFIIAIVYKNKKSKVE